MQAIRTGAEPHGRRLLHRHEPNKIDKAVPERRIAKLSDELTQLRRRRDQLRQRIDDTPEEITPQHVATLGEDIHNIVNYWTDTERRQLRELPSRS